MNDMNRLYINTDSGYKISTYLPLTNVPCLTLCSKEQQQSQRVSGVSMKAKSKFTLFVEQPLVVLTSIPLTFIISEFTLPTLAT